MNVRQSGQFSSIPTMAHPWPSPGNHVNHLFQSVVLRLSIIIGCSGPTHRSRTSWIQGSRNKKANRQIFVAFPRLSSHNTLEACTWLGNGCVILDCALEVGSEQACFWSDVLDYLGERLAVNSWKKGFVGSWISTAILSGIPQGKGLKCLFDWFLSIYPLDSDIGVPRSSLIGVFRERSFRRNRYQTKYAVIVFHMFYGLYETRESLQQYPSPKSQWFKDFLA
jgi:hypothetical protein